MTRERLRAVLAPATALAEIEGATLMLLSVELWTGSVFLRVAVLRSDETDELDAAYERAFAAWAAGPREDDPPPQPGERLTHVPVTIADDAGTEYRWGHRSAAGTGTEWRAEWKFEPGPSPAATRLTIAVHSDGQPHTLDLELPPA